MFKLPFNDPTKEISDEITVEVVADGKLVVCRKTVTSIDISTDIGQQLCLQVAEILGDKHSEAVRVIRREVGKVLMNQSGGEEKRYPWE